VRAEMTEEVLNAFAASSIDLVVARPHLASSIGARLKDLWNTFQQYPQAWSSFKKMLGIHGRSWANLARELPSKIKGFMAEGKKQLVSIAYQLLHQMPALRMYLDAAAKMPALGTMLQKALEKMPPALVGVILSVGTKAKSVAAWLDETLKKHPILKGIGILASAAIFAFVWFNVVEVSWDIPEIIRGFSGGYSFRELLHSLPESAVGFLIRILFPGIPGGMLWNVYLPITVALRLAWLQQQGLLDWNGGDAKILWEKIP